MKKKRLNFNDDFEVIYLRHEYIELANKLGLKMDTSYIKKHENIVKITAKIMYSKLRSTLQKVGFDEDDLASLTNIYMLYYMTLYSLQTNKKNLETFLNTRGSNVSQSEIDRADRNRLIAFLRQKLYHCSVVFARKARNIAVGAEKKGFFAETKNTRSASADLILEDHKEYGYRKVTVKEYKNIQENARKSNSADLFDKNGFKVLKVEQYNSGLKLEDAQTLFNDNGGEFYKQPDTIMQNREEESSLEKFKLQFQKSNQEDKKKILKRFIRRNSDNKIYKDEVRLAKKLIKKPIVVV
jgi:hypothetical protein